MIKYTLISVIAVISMVGCGGGGGGSKEPTTPTSSAPVAPKGFTYKTSQELDLHIEVQYEGTYYSDRQRQIIIQTNPDYDLSNKEPVILENSVIKKHLNKDNNTSSFDTSLDLGDHIDEIQISIRSLSYQCVFNVNDIDDSNADCEDNFKEATNGSRTISVTKGV